MRQFASQPSEITNYIKWTAHNYDVIGLCGQLIVHRGVSWAMVLTRDYFRIITAHPLTLKSKL